MKKLYISILIILVVLGIFLAKGKYKKINQNSQSIDLQENVTESQEATSQGVFQNKEQAAERKARRLDKVIALDVELEKVSSLRKKAILSEEDKKYLRETLSNNSLARDLFLELTEKSDPDSFEKHQERRLNAISYFEVALQWDQNPNRQGLIQYLYNFVVLDNLSENEELSEKRSYAADKVEAYILLKAYAPEMAKSLLEGSKNSPLHKLIKFAAGYAANSKPEILKFNL